MKKEFKIVFSTLGFFLTFLLVRTGPVDNIFYKHLKHISINLKWTASLISLTSPSKLFSVASSTGVFAGVAVEDSWLQSLLSIFHFSDEKSL